jgi:hypothetical protein
MEIYLRPILIPCSNSLLDPNFLLTPCIDDAAKLLNVSVPTVKAARSVLNNGSRELARAVEQERIAVSAPWWQQALKRVFLTLSLRSRYIGVSLPSLEIML